MDILSAYREVGSYRGAAAICGTTPKTVRREVVRHNAGGECPPRPVRERNYASVAELVGERVVATKARISAKRLLPAARTVGYAGSARNFAGWSRRRRPSGGAGIIAAGARRCGHPVSIW
jgi:hypothetical protein